MTATQRTLFEDPDGPAPGEFQRLDLPDADVRLMTCFLDQDAATRALERLRADIPWRQDHIRVFGKRHELPRRHAWFADDGLVYTWSGVRMRPAPWPSALLELRRRLRALVGVDFNTALANLYRDGHDTVGWHADDEPELGREPLIASLSLGAARDFTLKHRAREDVGRVTIRLTHGSLLLMGGRTQRCWLHALPRRRRVTAPRVNVTFRRTSRAIT